MRLFIAINFNDEIKQNLLELIARLGEVSKGRFTRPEHLHVTLAFLGEMPDARPSISAVDGLSSGPFALSVSGLGRFRRPGGDILWAGVELSPALILLHRDLCGRLSSAGITLEMREFRPHVTLGRDVVTDKSFDAARLAKTLRPCQMEAGRVSLMKSEFAGGRLVYTEIHAKSLR